MPYVLFPLVVELYALSFTASSPPVTIVWIGPVTQK